MRLRQRLLGGLFGLLLGQRLPQTGGEIAVPGINAPVSIRRDGFGIPYIDAANDADGWFGVGFCQGQDRAFQLELMLRVFRGTLAELIGSPGLPLDRVARRLGLADSARRQAERIEPEIKANLTAFARGVNAGVQLGLRRRPHEFLLLRSRPTPYTLVDVIGAAKLHALALASNWDIELARFQILCADGPAALADLDPTYRPDHPVAVPPGAAQGRIADRLSQDLTALREILGGHGGSNAWALAAAKTIDGSPILANDPHLRPMLPPHWYLARVGTPEWSAAGATYVGGPAFPAGHNGQCAWGVTATLADTTNLVINYVPPSKAICSKNPYYGLTNKQLSRWCRDLGETVAGTTGEKVERIIAHFDRRRPAAEHADDERASWYEYYAALARRDYALLRSQGVIEKDLETESKFEEATNYLFSEKLKHTPLKQPGSNHPDGLLSLGPRYLMWDNKSKESPVNLRDHINQFDGYMDKAEKPVPIFLVIGPAFTEESEFEATKYRVEHYDRTITLITAGELKDLAEEWASPDNKRHQEPFPLGLLGTSGRYSRSQVGKL